MNRIQFPTIKQNHSSHLYSAKQAFAYELITELADKKKNVFGIYCKLIDKYGEQKLREILSNVKDSFRNHKITNKVKIFFYQISQINKKVKKIKPYKQDDSFW